MKAFDNLRQVPDKDFFVPKRFPCGHKLHRQDLKTVEVVEIDPVVLVLDKSSEISCRQCKKLYTTVTASSSPNEPSVTAVRVAVHFKGSDSGPVAGKECTVYIKDKDEASSLMWPAFVKDQQSAERYMGTTTSHVVDSLMIALREAHKTQKPVHLYAVPCVAYHLEALGRYNNCVMKPNGMCCGFILSHTEDEPFYTWDEFQSRLDNVDLSLECFCAWCNRVCRRVICKKCGLSAYCNAECQKQHWPTHKKLCRKRLGNILARFVT